MAPHLVGVIKGQQEQVVCLELFVLHLGKGCRQRTDWTLNTPTCKVSNQHANKAGAVMGLESSLLQLCVSC